MVGFESSAVVDVRKLLEEKSSGKVKKRFVPPTEGKKKKN